MKKYVSVLLALLFILTLAPLSFAENTQRERYTVLVLETSSDADFTKDGELLFTASSSLKYVKEAALGFLSDLSKSRDKNYVAVVTYDRYAELLSGFTDQFDELGKSISALEEGTGLRNIADALTWANEFLEMIDAENAEKNIVLVTTGMTNNGDHNTLGPYDENTVGSRWWRSSTEVSLYAYANAALQWADYIKRSGVTIYTIGLFQAMQDIPEEGKDVAELFRMTAADLATSKDSSFPIQSPEQLQETFQEVAQAITGQPDFLLGDVDLNGTIAAADARLALRRSVGLEDYPEGSVQFLACDVDRDNHVTAGDARSILRASVGLEDPTTWS